MKFTSSKRVSVYTDKSELFARSFAKKQAKSIILKNQEKPLYGLPVLPRPTNLQICGSTWHNESEEAII